MYWPEATQLLATRILEAIENPPKKNPQKKFEIIASLGSSIWNACFSHSCITQVYLKQDESWLSLRPGVLFYVYMPRKMAIVCDNGLMDIMFVIMDA